MVEVTLILSTRYAPPLMSSAGYQGSCPSSCTAAMQACHEGRVEEIRQERQHQGEGGTTCAPSGK